MKNWHEDKETWLALDKMIRNSACDINEMLIVFHKYEAQMDPMLTTLLFGALGKFAIAYEKNRQENFDPPISFHNALKEAASDPRVNAMMQTGINNAVDNKVGGMI